MLQKALNPRERQAYLARVQEIFSKIKNLDDTSLIEAHEAEIPGGDFLVPVCRAHLRDTELIGLLAKWTRENMHTFPVPFPVSRASTKSWLKDRILGNPGRILFLVRSHEEQLVGQMGFINCLNDAGSMWLANILRGEPQGGKGIMSRAIEGLLAWAQRHIQPKLTELDVLASNQWAIEFYEKIGFREAGQKICWRYLKDGQEVLSSERPSHGYPTKVRFVIMHHLPQNGQ